MDSATLKVTAAGGVETWIIDDPATRNAITSPSMMQSIVDAVERVNEDDDVRCVILTGAGTTFSSGGNVHAMAARTGMFAGTPHVQYRSYAHGIQRVARAVTTCEVPLIAAINGPAIGAGCDLALMCDLRIASTSASLAESFVQLGLIPGDGGAWLLTQLIGPARAAEMALTGDRVDAAVALEWGLVSGVSAPESLMTDAMSLAQRVAKNPGSATRMAKKLLRRSLTDSFDSVLDLSGALQPIAHHTPEHAEAVNALSRKLVSSRRLEGKEASS